VISIDDDLVRVEPGDTGYKFLRLIPKLRVAKMTVRGYPMVALHRNLASMRIWPVETERANSP
jgi:hypothetical protein